MERISTPIVFLSFLGNVARTLPATCTWHQWTLAFGNSSWKTRSRHSMPPVMLKLTSFALRSRLFRPLKSSHQLETEIFLQDRTLNTVRCPASVTSSPTKIWTLTTDRSIPFRVCCLKIPHREKVLFSQVDKDANKRDYGTVPGGSPDLTFDQRA